MFLALADDNGCALPVTGASYGRVKNIATKLTEKSLSLVGKTDILWRDL